MIRFKNHDHGFTLIEVMISLAVAALVLTPIFMLYNVIVRNVNRDSHKFNAVLSAKQVLNEAAQKQQPDTRQLNFEKKFEDFGFIAKYELQKIKDKKSSLGEIEDVYKEMVTVEWTDINNQKRAEQLVTFVYKPELKEQKKK